MAKLSSFRVDSNAIQNGEWVSPGAEYGDVELKVRGFTDQYVNAHQARLRRAAKGMGGDPTKLPTEVSRAIMLDCLVDHVLLDVRGLENDEGAPVTLAQFAEHIRNPDYKDLADAVVRAAARVGLAKAEDAREDAGNSAPLSA